MKNSKLFKLLITALSFALILCAFTAFGASAESEAPVIVSKNVSYEGALHLYFAIPPSASVTAENTTVKIYDSNPETDYAPTLLGSYTGQLEEIEMLDGEYIVVRTGGISAKDIAKYVYAQAESDGNKGEVVRYSVAEYLYERLYVSENTDDLQRELYNITLQYGIKAQAALTNKGLSEGDFGYETPIAAYRYVYVDEDTSTLDGDGFNSGLYLPGDSLTLTYRGTDGANAWSVNYINDGGVCSSDILTESLLTVTDDHAIISPAKVDETPTVTEYQSFDKPFKDSAYNGVDISGQPAMKVYYNDNIYLDAPANSTGVSLSVVANPSGGGDNVLKLQKNNLTNAPMLCVTPIADEEYNAIIFEAEVFVNYTSGTRLEFYFKTADGETAMRFRIEGSSSYQFRDFVGDTYTSFDVSENLSGKWFNIRIEEYDLDGGAKTLLFINGKKVDSSAYETFGTTFKDYAKLEITPYAAVSYDLYLDDVMFRKVNKEYEEPTGAETFNAPFKDAAKENLAITDVNKLYYNNSIFADRSGSNAAIDCKFGIALDPTDAANKVLKLHKSTSDASVTYQSNVYVNPKNADAYNALVFEADVYVDLLDTSTANVYEFQLSNSGTLYQRIAIGFAEGNISTRIVGEPGGSYKPTEVAGENNWYNIRIEYYVEGRTVVYINDVKVEDSTYIYNDLAAPATLDKLTIQTWGGTMVDLYLDNLIFKRVTK